MAFSRLVPRLLLLRVVTTRTLKSFTGIGVFLVVFLPLCCLFDRLPTTTAALQPAEPDYRVINLPTTLRLPVLQDRASS